MRGNKRFDARRDKSEGPIVDALRKAGYLVYRELPVDILVRKPYWEPGTFFAIENKTPQKRGGIRKRKDQPKQDSIVAECGIPRVTTPAAALEAVRGIIHDSDA